MARRTLLKWLHWGSFFLIGYFFLVEPEDVRDLGAAALATHAGVGIILAIVVTLWTAMVLVKGLAGRPGPKLPAPARKMHRFGHIGMHIALPLMVASGALAGFAAPFVVRAFGVLPISGGWGSRDLHEILQEVHEVAFNLMMTAIVLHAAFHIWRHVWIKDNALRIMAPKVLHRFL